MRASESAVAAKEGVTIITDQDPRVGNERRHIPVFPPEPGKPASTGNPTANCGG